MAIASIINEVVNMISGSERENTPVGCFFVDAMKRQPKRIVRRDTFTVSPVANKKGEEDSRVRLLDVRLRFPRRNSATVKNTPCIHDAIPRRILFVQNSNEKSAGEPFNRKPINRASSSCSLSSKPTPCWNSRVCIAALPSQMESIAPTLQRDIFYLIVFHAAPLVSQRRAHSILLTF